LGSRSGRDLERIARGILMESSNGLFRLRAIAGGGVECREGRGRDAYVLFTVVDILFCGCGEK
jgi:hypothetical protein